MARYPAFYQKMRIAEDRVRFYGLAGYHGARPLNVYLLCGGMQEWDEHTCALSAEDRLLRAIFAEENPCCSPIHKSEYVPAPFVRAEIRKA